MMVEPMNWISEVVRPRIKTLFKRETPENLWIKCPDTGQMVFQKDVEANLWVIPGSEHHLKMSAQARLKMIFDEGTWIDVPLPEVAPDPLKFRDSKRYIDRLKGAAKLRPDSKLSVARDWPTPEARLNGAVQLSRGLARVVAAGAAAENKELEPA